MAVLPEPFDATCYPIIEEDDPRSNPPSWRSDGQLIHKANPAIAELAERMQWVLWRGKLLPGGRINKPPFRVGGREFAEANNPKSWDTFDACWRSAFVDGFADGVGYVFSESDPFCGIDLDNCRDPNTGELNAEARSWIDRFASYTEISPSATGVKIICRGALPGTGRKVGNLEICDRNKFFTVTGNHLDGTPEEITEAQDAIDAFLTEINKRSGTRTITAQCEEISIGGKTIGGEVILFEGFRAQSNNRGDLGDDRDPRWRTCSPEVARELLDLLRDNPSDPIAECLDRVGPAPNDPSRSGWMAKLACLVRKRHGPDVDWIAGTLVFMCRRHEGWLEKLGREVRRTVQLVLADDQPVDWPEPIDLIGGADLTAWPAITPDCLPSFLHDFAINEGARLGIDPVGIANHAIAACSASISDEWRIKPKRNDHWTQQARIWSCVVKDVSQRGSDVIKAAFDPLATIEEENRNNFKNDMAAWSRRVSNLEAIGQKHDPSVDPKPELRTLTTRSTTVEGARDRLSEGCCDGDFDKLAIMVDELAGFFGSFNQYNSNSSEPRSMWLEAYDGGPKNILRSRAGKRNPDEAMIHVPNWSAVVSGNIQDRKMRELAGSLATDGLFHRFSTIIMRPDDPNAPDDPATDPTITGRYVALMKLLRSFRPKPLDGCWPGPVQATPEAIAERERLIRLIKGTQADRAIAYFVREAVGKWSGLHARLCLLFHMVERAHAELDGRPFPGFGVISGRVAEMAGNWLRRVLLPNLVRVAGEYMEDDDPLQTHARWIAGHLLAHEDKDTINARDIGRAYRPLRGKHGPNTKREIEQVMGTLEDAGWVRPAKGRTKDNLTWQVNPAIRERFKAYAEQERQRREAVKAAIQAGAAERRR